MNGPGLLLFVLAATAFAPSSAADEPRHTIRLKAQLDRLFDEHEAARQTNISLKVVDLESGDILYDRGGDRLLTPASNLKIYTAAAALDRWGPGHTFTTQLAVTGPIEMGILDGDLVLRGGGDAMLTSDDLLPWIDERIQELKLKEIRGRVLVDNRRYASPFKGPGWMWDDDPDYYNMSITPLMVDFNVLTVHVAASSTGPAEAAAPASVALVPATDYPPLERRVDAAADAPLVTRTPFEHAIRVVLPARVAVPRRVRLTMHDPGQWVASMVRRHLAEQGLRCGGSPGAVPVAADDGTRAAKIVATRTGEPLAEQLRHFHHVSENAVGEVLLHELAVASSQPATWSGGARAVSAWLIDTAGLEPGSFRIVDGSGLSRYNLISADSSVKLLAHMHNHQHADVFFESLPKYLIGGDRIEERNRAEGEDRPHVAAKGGSMSGVSTISGYLTTQTGRRLAFSLLANGFIGSGGTVRSLRAQVWSRLVEWRSH